MGKSTINGPFSIAMLVYQRVNHNFLMLFRCFSHWMQNWATGGEQFDGLSTVQVDFLSRAKHVFPLKNVATKKVNLWWKRCIYGEKGGLMSDRCGIAWAKWSFSAKNNDWPRQNYVYPGNIVVYPRKNVITRWTLKKDPTNTGNCMWCKLIPDGLSGDFLNKMQWARQTFFYILKN